MSFYVQGSKIRVDFLDLQTQSCCDKVLLADGIPSRFDLGSPFNIDLDYCQEDVDYYEDYYQDYLNYGDYDSYYDYFYYDDDDYDYYYDNYINKDEDGENKAVLKPNSKNQQNIRKVKESDDNKGGLVNSINSKEGYQGTKSISKKTLTNQKIKKREGNKRNQKSKKKSESHVSKDKLRKKEEAKRVLNKKNQKNQTIKKGSKLDERRKIKENYKKTEGKPSKPGKRPGKPGKAVKKRTRKSVKKQGQHNKNAEIQRNHLLSKNFDPDQIIAVGHNTFSVHSIFYAMFLSL